MNKERLLKLADLLEANATNPKGMKFDLATVAEWAGDINTNDRQLGVDCNTAGCAIGLAALSKAFEADGLTYAYNSKWDDLDLFFKGNAVGFTGAGAYLFDITINEAEMFFDPAYYVGRVKGAEGELRVAKRIRHYVESDGEELILD